MNFEVFHKILSKIEKIELPGENAQFKMVPPFRQELVAKQKNNVQNAKKAAVLALFYPDANDITTLVLILRKTYKGVHSAQVGFPGGRLEANETLQQAAVRETFEEVGVLEQSVKVIREMTSVYIPPSNFFVYPFLGITHSTPNFIKQDDEVEDIIEVKLSDFLSDTNIISKIVKTSYTVEVEVPAFSLNDHVVWGATAMMLSEVKDLLNRVL